ncbi:glycosyltransferase family A protein [Cohnella sp. AR92]|uniref:glycosyltransferase family 2 protein n=1 Tax=Cohnella sp. AR92 TaxID=648716 RepID=UPI000F8C7217|nr:glycosyltransferase family A protein [Cohnella sp. AR92]RUS45484.1 glycosyltransferase family 2 protein [Cohnella sp. AR92]
MINQGDISVAVPTRRRPDYLRACLQSIFDQTLLPSEVIVSEDGEDDETKQVVERFRERHGRDVQIVHVVNETPIGQLANRNQAFSLATREYVAMLDDDDAWGREFLEKTFAALSAREDCGFCSSNHGFMNSSGEPLEEQSRQFLIYSGRDRLVSGAVDREVFLTTLENKACIYSLQFTLFRREVLKRAGFFASFGGLVPDYTLMLVLGARREKAIFIGDDLGYARVHEGQQTKRRLENSLSKVECLAEIHMIYRHSLVESESRTLKKQYIIASVIECAIAYGHEKRRREAVRCAAQAFRLGFGFPPPRRLAVLAALLIGMTAGKPIAGGQAQPAAE